MTGESIGEFLHTAPFVPFTIHMADGKTYPVDHPDFATLSRDKQVLVINIEGSRFAWLDLALATRVEATRIDQPA
jgi:hypothetical protein